MALLPGISSHQDLEGSKMRFLIVSALIACAAAAPSGLAPFAIPVGIQAVAYPAAYPTISPGDLQAAAIDAQVKAVDQARAAVDQARELSEQAVRDYNEKVYSNNDQVNEKVVENFWSVEDKKWQALDAVKTAEAQIDGSIASNAEGLAKGAIVLPYAAVAPAMAPAVYSAVPAMKSEEKAEEKPAEMKEEVKSAAPEDMKDSVAIEAKPEEAKAEEPKAEEPKPVLTYASPLPLAPAALPLASALPLAQANLRAQANLMAQANLLAQTYRYPLVSPLAYAPVGSVTPVLKYGLQPYGLPVIARTAW